MRVNRAPCCIQPPNTFANMETKHLALPPGTPTTSIKNADGVAVAWEVIEDESRRIGIIATADKLKVNASAIRTRMKRHKWKGIPDGRTLVAQEKQSVTNSSDQPGDFSSRVVAHRENVFKKATDSLGKVKRIPVHNAKDFDIVDKIARRAAGIDDNEMGKTAVLIHINDAIEAHGENQPIEATVIPCLPAPVHSLGNGPENQGDSAAGKA
jgi:hypothetical protein